MTEQLSQLVYWLRTAPTPSSLLLIPVAKKLFRAIFDYSPANEDELTLKAGDIVEFLGHEEEGWYSGQLKGQTGVFPFNYVEELSSPGSVSSAPTTDGKQLSSVAVSKIHSGKSLIAIPKEGGAATLHHDDPTRPTSAGETECLLQCMRVFIFITYYYILLRIITYYYYHLLTSMGCLLGERDDTALSSH